MLNEKLYKSIFFLGIFLAVAYGAYELIAPQDAKNLDDPFHIKNIIAEAIPETHLYFYAFNTKAGAACWDITQAYNPNHDSVRYFLHMINPADGKELHKISLTQNLSVWNSSDAIEGYSSLKQIGKYVWLINKKEIEARDATTGEVAVSEQTLEQKFPELKSGIGEAESYWWANSIKITSKDGYIYYYLPGQDELMTEKEQDESRSAKNKKDIRQSTSYIFSDGIRKELYQVKGPKSKYDDEINFSTSWLKYFESDDQYWKRNYSEYSIKKLEGGNVFINGTVLSGDSSEVIVAFQKEASDDSPILLEGIFSNGTKWTSSDTSLNCLREGVKNSNLDSTPVENNLLIVKSYGHRCIGVDVRNGKIVFDYSTAY